MDRKSRLKLDLDTTNMIRVYYIMDTNVCCKISSSIPLYAAFDQPSSPIERSDYCICVNHVCQVSHLLFTAQLISPHDSHWIKVFK